MRHNLEVVLERRCAIRLRPANGTGSSDSAPVIRALSDARATFLVVKVMLPMPDAEASTTVEGRRLGESRSGLREA
jgi:hypothetical protein